MIPNLSEKSDEEIAKALVSIMEGQDAIMRMLWSVRQGIQNPGFLDDSDFQLIQSRRNLAKNSLKNKYKIF